MKRIFYLLVFLFSILIVDKSYSQGFLKKLKEKANKAIEKSIGIPQDNSSNNSNNNNSSQQGNGNQSISSNSGNHPSNKQGAGLTNTTPPDVKAQMMEAETAHNAKNYSDARYSLQQALMGVEIQLGKEILKSLPQMVNSLTADTLEDKVMSTQWGWNNLSIQRIYKSGKEKQMTMNIGNAGIYSGIANMYFANAGMINSNDNKQNIKQIRVKGYKAIIEYENSKGYTVMLSLGQSSMIVWECINFTNEEDVMTSINGFEIDPIKKMLGEQ